MEFLLLFTGLVILFILWQKRRIPAKIKEKFSNNDITNLLNELPDNCFVLHDVYIPRNKGTGTKIKHIVINQNGLFVIDTKNHNGIIRGRQEQKYWTQTIAKETEYFINPIMQNETRIRHLQRYMLGALQDIPVQSVIVFGKHALLKLDQPMEKAFVLKKSKLNSVLLKESKHVFIYYNDREYIYEILYELSQKHDKKREKKYSHIVDINQYRERDNTFPM